MPLKILNADITTLKVDAIVNAANTNLLAGGGVCGAIFRAAGYRELQVACNKLSPIQTGEAVITPGFNLPAKFIIHTAGPVWQGGNFGEENLLRSCYTNSLKLADENNLQSIAFPLISSGIYGYPPRDALKVAIQAVKDFLSQKDLEVVLTVMDKSLLDSAAQAL
ncbi:MAG: macro domain-containing protein [Selenomonadaceae bacterium]|nr:macro domain-containing protein [Selenomonadaceae bacterium]